MASDNLDETGMPPNFEESMDFLSSNVPPDGVIDNNENDILSSTEPKYFLKSNYANENYLAHGAFGKVFEAIFVPDQKPVAIKKLNVTPENEETFKQEIEILKHIKHENIIAILGVVDNMKEHEMWIVTELMDAGSLRPFCTGEKCETLDWPNKLGVAVQCCSAVVYLHNQAKICHRDIKPENFLLNTIPDGFLVKLCDFGLAEVRDLMSVTTDSRDRGTVMYFPPEAAEQKLNPEKFDVYSLGATLCELFVTVYYWHNSSTMKKLPDIQIILKLGLINEGIKENQPETYFQERQLFPGALLILSQWSECPPRISDILQRAVAFDRRQRPTAQDILEAFETVARDYRDQLMLTEEY